MTNYREGVAPIAVPAEDSAPARLGYRFVKRSFDIVASFILILLCLIPMAVIALAIKIDSKGSVIFRQKRVGKGSRLFTIYKFRTMQTTAPAEVATKDLDSPFSYITRVGAFLRKTSIDELPQLFNVLKGDMSFIGPRPLIAGEADVHRLRSELGVYDVAPGLTGWAQVNGRDNVSPEEKVWFDRYYVNNRSVRFDISIFIKTIQVVIKRDGFVEGKQSDTNNAA